MREFSKLNEYLNNLWKNNLYLRKEKDFVGNSDEESLEKNFQCALKLSKQLALETGKDFMSLSPSEGRLLSFLVCLSGAKKAVEIGTFTGYSALWIWSGLKRRNDQDFSEPQNESRLWTIEKDPHHLSLSNRVFNELSNKIPDLSPQITLLEAGNNGEALLNLEKEGPFDFIFIDANKSAYLDYLKWSEQNLRVGGLLVADNALLNGSVYDNDAMIGSNFSEKQIQVMKTFNQTLAQSPKWRSAFVPTSDGFLAAIKGSSF